MTAQHPTVPLAVVMVPVTEWMAVLQRLEKLEERDQTKASAATAAADDPLITSREAAKYLGMKDGRSVTKARRGKRLAGVLINEKEWGFRTSELDRYLNRYNRPKA